jgi:transposase
MKLYSLAFLTLSPTLTLAVRPAFVGPSHRAIRLSATQLDSKAEEHLQEITESWTELAEKEKEIEKHPDGVRRVVCDL